MSFIQDLLQKRKQLEAEQGAVYTPPPRTPQQPTTPADEGLAQQMLLEDQYRLRPQFNQPPRN